MESTDLKRIAFIFARGGSKGLPGKNIKPLAGKPLITYAIEVAQASPLLSAVYVSTDDPGIADVARDAGAQIIIRPDELASDNAPEWLAWRHAIETVTAQDGDFDVFVSLPTTSPLRGLKDVHNAIEKFESETADVCLTLTEAGRSPYLVAKDDSGGLTLAIASKSGISRRQDVPEIFDITTVAYVLRPDFIRTENSLFAGKVVGVIVPRERAVDIDDIWDFRFAESLIKGSESC